MDMGQDGYSVARSELRSGLKQPGGRGGLAGYSPLTRGSCTT